MDNHPVVFFDGVCGLCDRSVQFIIRHDRKRGIRYAALQSPIAQQILGDHITFDSFVFYQNGKAYYQSTAALKVLKELGGRWRLLYVLIIVPTFIRDAVYDFIAGNRYRWFGKFDSCKIPTPEQRALFLD